MKKWIAFFTALVMLVSLCACANDNTYKGTAEEFSEILDRVASIPVGTMGVSMMITDVAVTLLDWCEATAMTDVEIAQATKAYYDTVDADWQEIFLDQVSSTLGGVSLMANEDTRAVALEAAGHNAKRKWDEETLSLAASLDDAL